MKTVQNTETKTWEFPEFFSAIVTFLTSNWERKRSRIESPGPLVFFYIICISFVGRAKSAITSVAGGVSPVPRGSGKAGRVGSQKIPNHSAVVVCGFEVGGQLNTFPLIVK